MIKENLNQLIKESILSKNNLRTEVLRAIKSEFLKWETAKNAKPLDEVSILNKMVKQREESSSLYLVSNRDDLAQKELQEIKILAEFLPAKATIAEIIPIIEQWAEDHGYMEEEYEDGYFIPIVTYSIPKKEMGNVIKHVKSVLNNVDGKELSEIVKEYLV